MTRYIVRTVLSTLALVLMLAGSLNLNFTSAQEEFAVVESDCQKYAGCPGGPTTCGTIIEQDGTIVKCGMK